ncbi:hypothetical protein [Moraxella ovis]|uniref:hypothetical protein n=1 Tax=Moraxella ovis TaxID=29433 RepID=UPI000D9104DB|nr:hypothetical protein [Moraxella ovis]SPX85336.1 Uncharacterised protein [Moraxella ovis]STZ06361.1 Uncharacterised protein [Moraxella ovis]
MKTLTHLELDLLSQFVHQRHYMSHDHADAIQSISLDYSAEDGYEIKTNKSKGKRTSLVEASLLSWLSSTISYAQSTHKMTIDKLVIAYEDETYKIELATSPRTDEIEDDLGDEDTDDGEPTDELAGEEA